MLDKIRTEENVIPMYIKIRQDTNPLFIWGCGTLTIQVRHFCRKYGIDVKGCFVNIKISQNIQSGYFEDLQVYDLQDVMSQYPKFSVIVGFSDYVYATEYLKNIANIENIYCIASVCCGVTECISYDYIEKNKKVLDAFYGDLADEMSKKCMIAYLESRINDKAEYMFPYYDKDITYYKNDVFKLGAKETLLDCGACVGDAIWSFIDAVKGVYGSVLAIEPDADNYGFLVQEIQRRNLKNIIVKKVCAYNKSTNVHFGGNIQSGRIDNTNSKYELFEAVTIDGLCKELDMTEEISIVKINFLSAIPEILEGAAKLLRERRPRLIIRAAYDEKELIKIYLAVKNINPSYRLYLRYTLGLPQGLTLLAI